MAEDKLSETIRKYSHADLVIHRVNDSRTDAAFTDDYRTKEAYFRFLAPEVLPSSVNRVVYLDSDIVVLDDIAKLASIDLEGRAVGAVVDCDWGRGAPDLRLAELGVSEDHTYVASGVLVMDLDLWRSQGIAKRLFECVERLGPRLLYLDQDALNVTLQNEIHPIEKRWNMQALMFGRWFRTALPSEYRAMKDARRHPGIIHFTTRAKPWLHRTRVRKRALYFRYLDKTAWRNELPPLGGAALLEYRAARMLLTFGIDVYAILPVIRRPTTRRVGDTAS